MFLTHRAPAVEQILAVDDFLSFKKMMLKRNLELNVQAMSMMKVCVTT